MPHCPQASSSDTLAISFDHVSFAYGAQTNSNDDANNVLHDVTFSVKKGEYLAVLGPNGGGKTTMLKLMLGLLEPSQGSILMANQAPQDAVSRIGYVPQFTQARPDFPISVMDAVLMGMVGAKKSLFGFHWRKNSESMDRASTILGQVGLQGFEKKSFANLSGGQRQRVIVARALISNPEILLLDEPTASIDPRSAFCFYEFLASLQEQHTIVVVSHDLSITSTQCSAIAFVNRQVLLHRGSTLTTDMLHMLYGQHENCCPMSSFISTISATLPAVHHNISSSPLP